MNTFAFHALHRLNRFATLAWATLLFAGCGRNDIQVYRVAKDSSTPAAPPMASPHGPDGMPAAPAAPALRWKLPDAWEEVAPGEMRAASFRVKGADNKFADVGVFPLPGITAQDDQIVSLWRSELGLDKVDAAGVVKLSETVTVAGLPGRMYDQAGIRSDTKDKSRIIAAIVERDGVPWFFKMAGDDALVASQKAPFVEFLKSVTFEASPAAAAMPPGHPPMAGAASATPPAAAPGAGATAAGKPEWQVPAGWQEVPGGQFLFAKYQLSGPNDAKAAVNISTTAGDGGGLAANVNRWRGQLGLQPQSEAELASAVKPIDLAAGKGSLVELSGTDARTGQKSRLIAIVVSHGDQSWFYKLMGDVSIVEREQPAFLKFVQAVKY